MEALVDDERHEQVLIHQEEVNFLCKVSLIQLVAVAKADRNSRVVVCLTVYADKKTGVVGY
jgi:hypothetical protein